MQRPQQPIKALLIINPISGTSDKKGLEEYVRNRLSDKGFDVAVEWTRGRGDATLLARDYIARGYRHVIAAGGDGTINETARALRDTGVALGIIPCGSGNGLARHLGIPVEIPGSVEIIGNNRVLDCDYGTVNGNPFFCTFGTGFDATVSEKFAKDGSRGKITYIKNTFREYIGYRPSEYTISVNGNVLTERAFIVAVCNASQYGNNAYIAPHASLTDGLLDLTIVHYGNLISTALVGIDLLTGFIEHNMLIDTIRAPQLTIVRSDDGPVHIDGEPMEMGHRLEVMCHPAGLRIHVPETDHPFIPIITPAQSMMADVRRTLDRLIRRTI